MLTMEDKLQGIEERYEEIHKELAEVGQDYQRAADLGKERAELEPIVEAYRSYRTAQDEFKQAEGDPQVKRQIRTLQRQLLLNAMIKDLPDADVVVTNPTHYAVALKYDSDAMSAPKVVAKGARKMAEKINTNLSSLRKF